MHCKLDNTSSIQDLDRLTPYFLSLGKTVVVDWGWKLK